MYQFSWRPRPKNLLTSEELKVVLKNLKKYEKIFDKEDREKREQIDSAVIQERRRLASAYLARLASRRTEYEDTHAQRILLRDGYDSEDDENYQVVVKVCYQSIFVLISRLDGRSGCQHQRTNIALKYLTCRSKAQNFRAGG